MKVLPNIQEDYPAELPASQIAQYIASEKADAYRSMMKDDDLLITADTVVIVDDEVLGKPVDAADARHMLNKLSGRKHQVITGVCLVTLQERRCFSVSTDVSFKALQDEEINYYIDHYRPFDKAGAYGIQEWIGYVGSERIEGSYYNVMGLPVQRLHDELVRLRKG